MVPPIKLWDAGVPNRAALAIMTRNSRMPDSLAADLDAECSACLMGARRLGELFERYGVAEVEACFDAIIDRTTETYRREILAKIPVGTWVWEDYAEHDGVDEPRAAHPADHAHPDRRRRPRRRAADHRLRRHRAAGQGPDQPLRRLRRRRVPQEVARADPAQPRRHPGADGRARRQRGRRPADRDALPRARHAAHPGLPGADQRPHLRDPAAARRAGRRAGQGGRRADAGRPGDDPLHRRLRRGRRRPPLPDARGARRRLGRSLRTRTARTPSTSCPTRGTCPTEFTEARFPFRVEALSLAVDSGGAGQYRGGCGYEKHIRMLRDAHFMSIADRSILSCWGVNGGGPGRPFQVTIDPGGPHEREVDALADAEPVRAGEVIRIRTTGGGGWGDPFGARPRPRRPRRAVAQGVGRGGAARLRRRAHRVARHRRPRGRRRGDGRRAREPRSGRDRRSAFFDRGPGYARLAGGASYAEVDRREALTRVRTKMMPGPPGTRHLSERACRSGTVSLVEHPRHLSRPQLCDARDSRWDGVVHLRPATGRRASGGDRCGDPEEPGVPGAFADALRHRGVSLAWLHERLVDRGHPVSPAALSYWRSGRSQPERGTSRDALVEIERLLRVAPGDLPPARSVASAGPAPGREDHPRALRGRRRCQPCSPTSASRASTTSWSSSCATSRSTSTHRPGHLDPGTRGDAGPP